MRNVIFVVLAAAASVAARAQSNATLRGVDVFHSPSFSSDDAYRLYGDRLVEYVHLRNEHTAQMDQKAEKIRREIQTEVAARPGILFAELNFSEYFTAADHAMYATFDVVDKSDRKRLNFRPAPQGSFPDPDGLLAGWHRYMEAGDALSQRGAMSFDRPNCPGFYCLWSGTPEIDGLQASFKAGAVAHAAELRSIVAGDKDGEKRASALFVLSYSASGRDVLSLCHEALSDPDPRVRGAALQILADMASHHKELPIALARVLPCLDDPTSSVRGKAMGTLIPLVERVAYRQVMYGSTPQLIALLKLHQPESRDLAFTLLGLLSGKTFDKTDYPQWERWAARAAVGMP